MNIGDLWHRQKGIISNGEEKVMKNIQHRKVLYSRDNLAQFSSALWTVGQVQGYDLFFTLIQS